MGETVPIRPGRLLLRALRVDVQRGQDAGAQRTSAGESLRIGTAPDNDLVLTDPTVSRYHLELRRAGDRIEVTDLGSTNGTEIGPALLREGAVAVTAGTALRVGQSELRVDDGDVVSLEVHAGDALGRLRGRTPSMLRLMAVVRSVATAEEPVLLVGESGAGKHTVARAIHEASPRTDAPFVVVDCGALSPAVVSTELFGREDGADRWIGALERAKGGTVLLDDVAALPVELQAALGLALERRAIRRVGGLTDVPVDFRLLAATTRDLRGDVNAGRFRLDLYHRIAVVLLRVPPLREHAADIPLLVEHFLREAGASRSLEELVTPDALETMQTYPWPGNVRELRNVVTATLALGETPNLEAPAPDAPTPPPRDLIADLVELPYREARGRLLAEFETRYLGHLLARTGGNVRQAAREARMDRSYLIELLRRQRPA